MKKLMLYSIYIFSVLGCLTTFAQEEAYTNERQDMFYEEIHASKRRAVELPSVREADIVWKEVIWRSINLKERFNQFFYYPSNPEVDAQGRTNLIYAIWNGAKEGKITVYEDDEFKIVKEFDKLEALFNKVDTNYIDEYDDYENYIGQQMVISRQEFADLAKDFYKIELKENWFIDKARTGQSVRIIGLSFVRDVYRMNEATGEREYLGPQPFGWIKMQDPAVRELLAQTQAYNEYNDAEWRNYDQIFLMRYFESFITRKSNIQNRSIDRYLVGIDALVEAERIKNELFNKEEDLWEY